jgi:hypothetical protein
LEVLVYFDDFVFLHHDVEAVDKAKKGGMMAPIHDSPLIPNT